MVIKQKLFKYILFLCILFVFLFKNVSAFGMICQSQSQSLPYVSDESDSATNIDPEMQTEFTMYIAPDPQFEDIPKTGDFGIDTNILFLSTLITGSIFLILLVVLIRKEKNEKS